MVKLKKVIGIVSAAVFFIALGIAMEMLYRPENAPLEIRVLEQGDYPFVDTAELKKRIGKKFGTDTLDAHLEELELFLKGDSYIRDVQVYRTKTGRIRVDVKGQQPYCRIFSGEKSYYLTSTGAELPLLEGKSAEVPFFFGTVSPEVYPDILRIARRIEKDDFLRYKCAGINILKNRQGDKIIYTFEVVLRGCRANAFLGDASGLEEKLENLGILFAYLEREGKAQQYSSVNLEFVNHIICRK